ncbi:LPS export ABC transporter periplasmic protein LptC [Thauera sinica]|uniref:LPS export ABC transporter periplasmic protein LptC n=1 Tax=Thauera sinica TaxID=2665146 RepID=A0ABW1AXJ0_9RHOO|nr:LPS export ABC transporter periplasmic protein LptC [Thauera sp. K11]ATE58672.1 LPS export ABC transporter periplasmic protein LptC [Thauera sp. K11]
MQTAYRLYPLVALTVIAGASLWLDRITRVEEAPGQIEPQTGPDFAASNTRIVGYAHDGSQRYELLAERLEHFPADDTTRLTQPRLTVFRPGTEFHVTAANGKVSPGGEQIDLSGDVRARRSRSADAPELVLASETLTVWPDPQSARTDQPVRLTQGQTIADALGLEADNLFGTLNLTGQVKVHMPRRQDRSS